MGTCQFAQNHKIAVQVKIETSTEEQVELFLTERSIDVGVCAASSPIYQQLDVFVSIISPFFLLGHTVVSPVLAPSRRCKAFLEEMLMVAVSAFFLRCFGRFKDLCNIYVRIPVEQLSCNTHSAQSSLHPLSLHSVISMC
jgi:hypothetical protein